MRLCVNKGECIPAALSYHDIFAVRAHKWVSRALAVCSDMGDKYLCLYIKYIDAVSFTETIIGCIGILAIEGKDGMVALLDFSFINLYT